MFLDKRICYNKIMNFKKLGIILFLIFSLFPINKINAQISNTGFVSASIWYSKDPFVEGDKIKIHTFVFNPDTTRELSGTVIFFDKTTLLGKKDFIIQPNTANDVSINWTATAGDHIIFGKIENSKFLISKGKYEEVYLTDNETEKSSRTVSKKIISKTTDITTDIASTPISDMKKIIEDKTPTFITKPIIATTNKLDEFRENTNISTQNKKEEVKKEITELNKTNTTNSKTSSNSVLKPFKYAELFFLNIFSFVLNNKVIFYSVLFVIIFFLLRYFWKKIF